MQKSFIFHIPEKNGLMDDELKKVLPLSVLLKHLLPLCFSSTLIAKQNTLHVILEWNLLPS